jgi:hypothetical protein
MIDHLMIAVLGWPVEFLMEPVPHLLIHSYRENLRPNKQSGFGLI